MHVGVAVRHPEHARFYRPVVDELFDRSHDVSILVREHGHTTDLLSRAGLSYTVLAGDPSTRSELVTGHLRYEAGLLARARRRGVDVLTAIGGRSVSHVAPLAGARSVVFLDWEPSRVDRAVAALADAVCTPPFLSGAFGANQVVYDGLHELSYLPAERTAYGDGGTDPSVGPDDAALVGIVGATDPDAAWVAAVRDRLAARGRAVVVSDANDSAPDDAQDRSGTTDAPTSADDVRPLLARADVCVSDRGTLTTEAALLGCPVVHVGSAPRRCRYLRDEYDLVVTAPAGEAHDRVEEILADESAASTWQRRRERVLDDSIDVPVRTADLVLRGA